MESSIGDRQRKRIFEKYSSNLHLLVKKGYIKDIKLCYKKTYICPICKRQFSEASLNQSLPNPLTLEDAPPKSLGGKPNILTCKECNNYCGQNIDNNLGILLQNKDSSDFIPNSEFLAEFINKEGIVVKGSLRVNSDNTMTVLHDKKHNKPHSVDDFAELVTDDPNSRYVDVKTMYKKFDHGKANFAILKTSYLLMFQELGYVVLFNEVYRRINNQLLDVSTLIYPTSGWLDMFKEKPLGNDFNLSYISNRGMECFFISFPLKTKVSVYYYSALLPCHLPIFYIISTLDDNRNNVDHVQLRPHIGLSFEKSTRYDITNLSDSNILTVSGINKILSNINLL